MSVYFPFAEYWWVYLGFLGLVGVLLAIDLGVFHRHAHRVSFREALVWTIVWITLALVFNFILYQYALHKFAHEPRLLALPDFDSAKAAKQVALEFLTGFLVEKALAVDNIFIFAVVFSYFGVHPMYQHRVLFFGILGALFFRAFFIAIGSVLMRFHAVVVFFGILLIYTGLKLLFAPEKKVDPDKNALIRLFRKFVPVTNSIEGQEFFVRREGKLWATPLFVALLFLELTDIVFAIDSVPAIFALTKEPLIVFTSNIFAILGLRAMYLLLASVMDRFIYLKYGLSLILIFVGLKMAWLSKAFKDELTIGVSLGIIGGILVLSVIASLVFPRHPTKVSKHP